MATPLSADRLLAALRAEGVKVAEYRGWRTHNRNHKGPWGGVNGVMIHHTAGTNSLALCYDGTSALPGPLCHTHLAKDGTATMVGHGRTNHAGSIAANAHQAVVAESGTHPRPDAAEPVDGNRHYYGIEIENRGDGKDPYPPVQYDQAVRWAAAICRAHGWGAESVIGHKEATRRKIDPSFYMPSFRRDVAERLAHSADWSPDTTHDEHDQEDTEMPTAQEIAKAVWEHRVDDPLRGGDAEVTIRHSLAGLAARAGRIERALARLTAEGAARDAVLARLAEGGELDAAEIRAAAEAGAAAALDRLADALQDG